jgi:hypothetical protein
LGCHAISRIKISGEYLPSKDNFVAITLEIFKINEKLWNSVQASEIKNDMRGKKSNRYKKLYRLMNRP